MSASRTDNSTLSAYYKHTADDSGDVTVWGHNSTSTVDWTTSANLTSGSACLTNSEFFNSNFSDSLTTNSTWSQSDGGPIVGENNAIYSRANSYSGGSSNDYGGSYAYSGGQNWTWSDPNLSTYNARALSEIRITPASPPDVGPVTFRSAWVAQLISAHVVEEPAKASRVATCAKAEPFLDKIGGRSIGVCDGVEGTVNRGHGAGVNLADAVQGGIDAHGCRLTCRPLPCPAGVRTLFFQAPDMHAGKLSNYPIGNEF